MHRLSELQQVKENEIRTMKLGETVSQLFINTECDLTEPSSLIGDLKKLIVERKQIDVSQEFRPSAKK